MADCSSTPVGLATLIWGVCSRGRPGNGFSSTKRIGRVPRRIATLSLNHHVRMGRIASRGPEETKRTIVIVVPRLKGRRNHASRLVLRFGGWIANTERATRGETGALPDVP